jgi:ATP-dependent RNA helicase RhlE
MNSESPATRFASLGLSEPLLRALAEEGYTAPTSIQTQAIPHLMRGRDLVGLAQTGTGKTAAFALPILHRLTTDRHPPPPRGARVLVLAPTRELATQIAQSFAAYGRHTHVRCTVVFGGVGQNPQVAALRRGVDVLVAAPGRLLDLMSQGHCDLAKVEVLVLDEADRMLDMGFARDIARIVARLPKARQTLLFSATMPAAISSLSAGLLRDPAHVEVTPPSTTVAAVRQTVMFVDQANKRALLATLMQSAHVTRAIVFTLTKHGADKVVQFLTGQGIAAAAIHGNKSQNAREAALGDFRAGKLRVLVATDIASRGIDVDDVSHVFNFDLPNIPEAYVHRIGRTARAGRDGWAVSLCDAEQRAWLRAIEQEIGQKVPVFDGHPFHSDAAAASTMKPPVLGGGGRQQSQKARTPPANKGPKSKGPQGGRAARSPSRRRAA